MGAGLLAERSNFGRRELLLTDRQDDKRDGREGEPGKTHQLRSAGVFDGAAAAVEVDVVADLLTSATDRARAQPTQF